MYDLKSASPSNYVCPQRVLFKVVFAYLKHQEKLSSDLAVGPTGSQVDQQNLISQASHTCPVQGSGEIPTKQVIWARDREAIRAKINSTEKIP